MSSIFSSFFQLGGAKSFSEFLKDDDDKVKKGRARRSLKKTVAQRKSRRRTARKTARRSTARKTARRSTARKTARRSTPRKTARRSTPRRTVQRRIARRSTPRRTAQRRTAQRRTVRRREIPVRKLTNRKHKGENGHYECTTCNKGVKAYYTGKEPSPKGYGYCARCTPLNITMKGTDGNLWENKKYTKGKRWVRV